VVESDPDYYHALAVAGRERMARTASHDAAVSALKRAFRLMRPARPGATDWAA
jgi:hypothetical protein